MPQVASVSNAPSIDVRPPAQARQDGPTDSFSQLLDAVGNNSEPPQTNDEADDTAPQPARNDRHDAPQRADRKDDSDGTDRTDSKADTSDTGSTEAKDKPKDTKDASSDQDGKSKEHKDKEEAAADDVASVPPTTEKPVTASTEASTVAPAVTVPASADSTEKPAAESAPSDQTPAIDGNAPKKPAVMLPASDAAVPQTPGQATDKQAAAGQPSDKPQIPLATGEPASQQPMAAPQPQGKGDTKNTAPEKPAAAAKSAATDLRANIEIASAPDTKPAPTPAPNAQSPALHDDKTMAPNVAPKPEAVAETKPETAVVASTNAKEAQDDTQPKHLSTDVQITSNTQITLPNTTPSVQTNYTPVSVAVQTAPSAANNQPVPLQAAALAVEIAARAKDGSRQFDIRLDPPELGRIEVKLDVDKSGQVNTHLTVDRPETLDLLRRDSQGLERALQQAGLKTSDGSLEFSLRQQTTPDGSQQGRNQAQTQGNLQANGILATDDDQTSAVQAGYQWAARMRGGVDIRV